MKEMFSGLKNVKELDLSSFDMSNVTTTTNMFSGIEATIGYGKTQADVDIFNNSNGKPSSLVFNIK